MRAVTGAETSEHKSGRIAAAVKIGLVVLSFGAGTAAVVRSALWDKDGNRLPSWANDTAEKIRDRAYSVKLQSNDEFLVFVREQIKYLNPGKPEPSTEYVRDMADYLIRSRGLKTLDVEIPEKGTQRFVYGGYGSLEYADPSISLLGPIMRDRFTPLVMKEIDKRFKDKPFLVYELTPIINGILGDSIEGIIYRSWAAQQAAYSSRDDRGDIQSGIKKAFGDRCVQFGPASKDNYYLDGTSYYPLDLLVSLWEGLDRQDWAASQGLKDQEREACLPLREKMNRVRDGLRQFVRLAEDDVTKDKFDEKTRDLLVAEEILIDRSYRLQWLLVDMASKSHFRRVEVNNNGYVLEVGAEPKSKLAAELAVIQAQKDQWRQFLVSQIGEPPYLSTEWDFGARRLYEKFDEGVRVRNWLIDYRWDLLSKRQFIDGGRTEYRVDDRIASDTLIKAIGSTAAESAPVELEPGFARPMAAAKAILDYVRITFNAGSTTPQIFRRAVMESLYENTVVVSADRSQLDPKYLDPVVAAVYQALKVSPRTGLQGVYYVFGGETPASNHSADIAAFDILVNQKKAELSKLLNRGPILEEEFDRFIRGATEASGITPEPYKLFVQQMREHCGDNVVTLPRNKYGTSYIGRWCLDDVDLIVGERANPGIRKDLNDKQRAVIARLGQELAPVFEAGEDVQKVWQAGHALGLFPGNLIVERTNVEQLLRHLQELRSRKQ